MSENNQQEDNPYANRDHENIQFKKDDAIAMAGLLGSVAGELGRIDEQNVGGNNQFMQAKKMDPKQVLRETFATPQQSSPQPQPQIAVPPPVQQSTPMQPQPNTPLAQRVSELEKRCKSLEKSLELYKQITKFKRGVSYIINTSHIKGGIFKSPETILDLVAAELAKGSKSITIKLNNESKSQQ